MDVVDEAAHLPLPLLRGQPRVHCQVLHHVEIVAHFISQACNQGAGESQSAGLQSPVPHLPQEGVAKDGQREKGNTVHL